MPGTSRLNFVIFYARNAGKNLPPFENLTGKSMAHLNTATRFGSTSVRLWSY